MGNTMKLWISWAAAYVVCTICGLIPTSEGSFIGLPLMLLGMAFFIPPTILIWYVVKKKRVSPLVHIRNVSIIFLALTTIAYVLNMLTYDASEPVQLFAQWFKAMVATPMDCLPEQIQLLSVFGWACILMAAIHYLRDPNTGATRRSHKRRHSSK